MPSRGFCVRLEEYTHMNIIKFKKGRCKVQHLVWGGPQYQCRLGDGCIENCLLKKNLGIVVDEKLHISWPCSPERHLYSESQRQKHDQQG